MITTCFSVLVMFCIFVYFYAMVLLQVKNKGLYSPIRHAVSDYGIGEHKRIFHWAGWVSTMRTIFLITALAFWHYQFASKGVAILLLLFALVGYIGVVFFPTDMEGHKRSTKGVLHLLFAILQFTVLSIFLFQMTDIMSVLVPSFSHFFFVMELLIKIGLYGLVAALILPLLKPYFGIFERLFLYACNIYLFIFCLVMILN